MTQHTRHLTRGELTVLSRCQRHEGWLNKDQDLVAGTLVGFEDDIDNLARRGLVIIGDDGHLWRVRITQQGIWARADNQASLEEANG